MNDSMYITLKNNNEVDEYGNFSGSFKVKLPNKVILEDLWEIALLEMKFTTSWSMLSKNYSFSLILYDDNSKDKYKIIKNQRCIINQGDYEINGLIKNINNQIIKWFIFEKDGKKFLKDTDKEISQVPNIKHNDGSIYMTTGETVNKEQIYILFDEEFGDIMGLTNEIIKQNVLKNIAESKTFKIKPYNFNPIKEFYICCDLCKNSIVNNKEMNLLRKVNAINNNYLVNKISTDNYTLFHNPFYIPIKPNIFDSIKIDVLYNIGKQFYNTTFYNGNFEITIHLRKKNKQIENNLQQNKITKIYDPDDYKPR